MGRLDLQAWASDSPALQVPDELLRQSIERARVDIAIRREKEYVLYKNNMGADPKSPLGIASSFNRPNAAAIHLSNTSLLLEYASEEFIFNLEQ